MKSLFKNPIVFVVMVLAFATFSFTSNYQDKKPWAVPDNYKKMKNTVKNDAEAISIGKTLYAKHCRSCHGKAGEGDGTKAAELKTPPGDFGTKSFQAQTDGELFYKTSEGREDMPSFKKKIPEENDIWAIVHYMRTMKRD